jgi:hypothetical protein
MAWKIKFGGDKEVNLDDLSPGLFDELAADSPGDTWWTVYTFPAGNTERLWRVVDAAARHAGLDPVERPTTMKGALALVDMLERVDDIEDQPMQDGFPTTPEAPESGSTSGSPENTDGLPMSSGDSPSTTS